MKCGKKEYYSQSEANNTMRIIKDKGRKGKVKPQRSYYCTDCKAWHLSSRNYSPKRSK